MKTLFNTTFWKNPQILVVIGCLIASLVTEWYARSCGFIIATDSIQYLSAAKSFQAEGRFLSPDCTYYSYWPPLFPMLLSLAANPLKFLVWINILCKLLLAGMLFFMSNHYFKSTFFKSVFVGTSLLSTHVIMISVFVWTELLFLTLILLNVFFALNLHKRHAIYGLIITGFLICIQRNAGLFYISGISLWLLLDRENTFMENVGRSCLFFLISTSGLWIWNVYNTFLLPANFNFYKHSFFYDWNYNLNLIAETYSKMFVPFKHYIVLLAGLAFLIYSHWKTIDHKLSLVVCVLLLYTIGYASMVKLDVHEMDRYFSVMVPFAFLIVLLALEKVSFASRQWMRHGVIILTCIWLCYPVIRTIKNVKAWHDRSCFSESSI